MSVSANVQKNSLNKDGYTEYFLLILYKGSEWGIRKRYSDFVKFDRYLQESGYEIAYKLPEKNFWSRFDDTLISKRMVELQAYLNSLLQNTLSTDNNLIREFLEVDENILAMAIEQSKREPHKETTYDERLEDIVKSARRVMLGIEPFNRGSSKRYMNSPRSRQFSVQTGIAGSAGMNLTPPASPSQHSKVVPAGRSLSSDNRVSTLVSSSPNYSPQITPHRSFSQLGQSMGVLSGADASRFAGPGRDSREGRLSGAHQTSSRYVLGSSYSGQNSFDIAMAVEDAHRRECFSNHVSTLWRELCAQNNNCNGSVTSMFTTILNKEILDNSTPIPYTQEHAMLSKRHYARKYDLDDESGSDAEGEMFRDDNNSFMLDCLSEPVLTILQPDGLALHEALDLQADRFEELSKKRRPKLFANFGDTCIRRDWMNNLQG